MTGSTAGTPLTLQQVGGGHGGGTAGNGALTTPDALSTTSLTTPATTGGSNHLLPSYSDYNNYPTLPVSIDPRDLLLLPGTFS